MKRTPYIYIVWLLSLSVVLPAYATVEEVPQRDTVTAVSVPEDTLYLIQPMRCFRREGGLLHGWLFTAGAGVQIGGMTPTPMPRAIRKIEQYNPLLCLSLELQARKFFDNSSRWSASIGLRLEQKGMKTDASVKGYHMEMTADDGGYMEGHWTGRVKTHVRNSYLTMPLLLHYRMSSRWSVHAGPYVSLLLDGDFDGEAYDGYLRHHDPTGEKAYVTHATYDFGKDLRRWTWGIQAGTTCLLMPHLEATAQLTYGFNDIFPAHFHSVTFALHPIYARIGLNYMFYTP